MAAYINSIDAALRLDAYGIEAELTEGDVLAASNDLDSMGPFIGTTYEEDQARPFPRDETLTDDTEGEIPEAVLDWVALTAYQVSTDEGPAVTQESAGGVSVSYAHPKVSRIERLRSSLLSPYLRKVATR